MTDVERRFHETWLGMVQPSEGLVVSVPVLIEAQALQKQDRSVQEALIRLTVEASAPNGERDVCTPDVARLLTDVLGLTPDLFDGPDAYPKPLRLYVPEGKQELRPTLALKRRKAAEEQHKAEADLTAAASAGRDYLALVWQVPSEVDLDKPETLTGPWEYPAQAKFDRLLRECRVPIGILTNGREFRLVYAPHGESSGWLSFRVKDMVTVGGRPILDAFVLLLGRARFFGVAEEQQLPALLAQSRKQQANVTNELSTQVFEALEELLAGFATASERDPRNLLRQALEEEGKVYSGLLTLLLRLVFTLYCEDSGLLPLESRLYSENYSLLGLYDQLEKDHGKTPDSMDRRYGAYSRLLGLFRAVYQGVRHGDLHLPARRGTLFDPNEYSFLEGWDAGSAPTTPEQCSQVSVPSISDGTVYRVLKKLILLGGQRLSYRALEVEQIGSIYEGLMGFDVERLVDGAVRIKLGSKKGAARVWLEAARLLEVPAARRAKWLEDELGFDKAVAKKITEAVSQAKTASEALSALEPLSGKERQRVGAGALVIQPGPERRRTSSHYTPRSLSEPIVRKTLEPLVRAMGEHPSSEALLSLVICDPAMGSGAFLVEACRYLADHVVAAWTREGQLSAVSSAHESPLNYARRLVAQRCLYGVDKNKYAVQLARLSLWLVTMAKGEPFTFVDHALRHGDSLVGLNFDQIKAFHWKTGHKGEQFETAVTALREALDEAIDIRKQILELASSDGDATSRHKEVLLDDASDATQRVRLIGDLIVGAFFAHEKDKDREAERKRRLDLVREWLSSPDPERVSAVEAQLYELQAELLEKQVPFHWMLEFPEVFYLERPDPLDGGKVNGAAMVEAFVGNPPFAGKNGISEAGGESYLPWLQAVHEGAHGNADLSAHFFRRAGSLLGDHGTIGLIATNTIGQGDTRATGIQHLVHNGFSISGATTNMPWEGDAAVTVSVVHLVRGRPGTDVILELDGQKVKAISSRLRPSPERPDPKPLLANANCSFQGSIVLGMGFVLTPEEREALIAKDRRNGERIFPYLGGEEVNTSPTQSHERYVISFGQRELSEAEKWPDLLAIVRERVKPERDKNNRENYRERWWQFGEYRPGLFAAIAPLERCLVASVVSKHHAFATVYSRSIFSGNLHVFAADNLTFFAALQSRIHEVWVGLHASSLETRTKYVLEDCFETFPFPSPDPRTVLPELEALGERLYSARAAYMVETNQGLTKTYNALKDPARTDARILQLRALHEEMDRAVLRAYPKLLGITSPDPAVIGWSDLTVPPYCPLTAEDRAALQTFEDQIIDRLFVLNADRAAAEAGAAKAAQDKPAARKKASSKKKDEPSGQGSLGWD